MAIVVKSPNTHSNPSNLKSIFLAGSIENGKAKDWQSKVADIFQNTNVILYNPRRDDWDSTWKADTDDAEFVKQVNWELDHIAKSDYVIVYFDTNTVSPITLLELGILTTQPNKVLVCCPDGYFRKGNVEIVCQRYGITFIDDEDTFFTVLGHMANNLNK